MVRNASWISSRNPSTPPGPALVRTPTARTASSSDHRSADLSCFFWRDALVSLTISMSFMIRSNTASIERIVIGTAMLKTINGWSTVLTSQPKNVFSKLNGPLIIRPIATKAISTMQSSTVNFRVRDAILFCMGIVTGTSLLRSPNRAQPQRISQLPTKYRSHSRKGS